MTSRPLALLLVCLLGAPACYTGNVRGTTTARGEAELLLLSCAAERAIVSYDAAHLKGKKVFVDPAYLEGLDEGYVVSSLREHLAHAGAVVLPASDGADAVVEVSCATHGINDPAWLFGLPMLPVSIPTLSDMIVGTPAITLGYDPQYGWAALQLWSYDARSGVTIDLAQVWGRSQTGWFDDVHPSGIIGDLANEAGVADDE